MSLSVVSPPTPHTRGALWQDLRASLRENSPLILFSVFYCIVPFIVARAYSIPTGPYSQHWLAYLGFIATAGLAAFGAFALWYLYNARIRRVPGFQAAAFQRLRADFLHRDRLLLALP